MRKMIKEKNCFICANSTEFDGMCKPKGRKNCVFFELITCKFCKKFDPFSTICDYGYEINLKNEFDTLTRKAMSRLKCNYFHREIHPEKLHCVQCTHYNGLGTMCYQDHHVEDVFDICTDYKKKKLGFKFEVPSNGVKNCDTCKHNNAVDKKNYAHGIPICAVNDSVECGENKTWRSWNVEKSCKNCVHAFPSKTSRDGYGCDGKALDCNWHMKWHMEKYKNWELTTKICETCEFFDRCFRHFDNKECWVPRCPETIGGLPYPGHVISYTADLETPDVTISNTAVELYIDDGSHSIKSHEEVIEMDREARIKELKEKIRSEKTKRHEFLEDIFENNYKFFEYDCEHSWKTLILNDEIREYCGLTKQEYKSLKKIKWYGSFGNFSSAEIKKHNKHLKDEVLETWEPIKKALSKIVDNFDEYEYKKLTKEYCHLTRCLKPKKKHVCPDCQTKNPKKAKYCATCGKQF